MRRTWGVGYPAAAQRREQEWFLKASSKAPDWHPFSSRYKPPPRRHNASQCPVPLPLFTSPTSPAYTETTANALAFTIYRVSQSPEVQVCRGRGGIEGGNPYTGQCPGVQVR